jgi:hypothetical protein
MDPDKSCDLDKLELERKVYNVIKNDNGDLRDKIKRLKKKSSVWQAYVESSDSLGQLWRSFGRQTRGISDEDYSLAHLILFKNLPLGTKRVLVVKMENLMKDRPFMKSEEALELFKEFLI